MKANYIIQTISDSGEILNVYTFNKQIENVKEFNKEMLKYFSDTKQIITVKEIKYFPKEYYKSDYSEYKSLNKVKYFNEFKEKYYHPKMSIYSYRRVLYGKSTYLGKGKSPYIADMFKFFGNKLHKDFIDVAYDLLDSEYFGRKNTLLDVLIAEKDITRDQAFRYLGDSAKKLENIKLCDLNIENKNFYNNIISSIKKEIKI